MRVFFELLLDVVLLTIMLILAVGLLIVMLVSVIYIMGYVYDSLFGSLFIRLGQFVIEKYPKITENLLVMEIWKKIQPREFYLRYETPLFAYGFSYTAISMLALIIPNRNGGNIIVASALYLLFYFVGMARKCGRDEQYYSKVLENNMEFLKLSFLPLGCVITVLGFLFTITGIKVQELPLDFSLIDKILNIVINYSDDANILIQFVRLLISGVIILFFLYIISLPIQAVSYFLISAINYFRKHKTGYIDLFKKYYEIVRWLLKGIR